MKKYIIRESLSDKICPTCDKLLMRRSKIYIAPYGKYKIGDSKDIYFHDECDKEYHNHMAKIKGAILSHKNQKIRIQNDEEYSKIHKVNKDIATKRRWENIKLKRSTDPEYLLKDKINRKNAAEKGWNKIYNNINDNKDYATNFHTKKSYATKKGSKDRWDSIHNKLKTDENYALNWKINQELALQKRIESRKRNGTLGKSISKFEEWCGKIIKYYFNNVYSQKMDFPYKNYPGVPDYYIKDIDTIIEVQGEYWHMSKEPFDNKNPDHLKLLKENSISENRHIKNRLDNWTRTDPSKRKFCKENNIRLIEIWNSLDLYDFIKSELNVSFLPTIRSVML